MKKIPLYIDGCSNCNSGDINIHEITNDYNDYIFKINCGECGLYMWDYVSDTIKYKPKISKNCLIIKLIYKWNK